MLSQANCASLRPIQRPGKDPAGLWMRTRYSGIATLGRTSQNQGHTRAGCDERMVKAHLGLALAVWVSYSASGCGRSWKWMTELRIPFPPSMCQFKFDP